MSTIEILGLPVPLPDTAGTAQAPTSRGIVDNQALQPLAHSPRRATTKLPGYVPATPQTAMWGELPCESDKAVMSVWPGQALWIDTVSHEGMMPDQGSNPLTYFTKRGLRGDQILNDAKNLCENLPRNAGAGPHIVCGPIEVLGAEPGDTLIMTVEKLERRTPYGLVSNRHGKGALPEEFPLGREDVFSVLCQVNERGEGTMPINAERGAPELTFPLKPFLGIMGVATATPERANSVPPGAHGGNLDISELGEGASLHVPVQVPGALAYVGDPHFAQGDGEVALTAFEAPLRALVRFDLVKASDSAAVAAWGETEEYLIPFGIDPDLNEALRIALRNALDHLVARGVDRAHAYAYLSAAGDFAVSQVVDQTTGVHVKIRKRDLLGF